MKSVGGQLTVAGWAPEKSAPTIDDARRGARVPSAENEELWCRASGLAYPIRDSIPVMLEEEARELSAEERESLKD